MENYKKVGKVLREYKEGKLHSGRGKKGKKGKVVKSRKQAVAIALSEAGMSKKIDEGVRKGLKMDKE
jgi:ribosomal protein L21E